ncbi:hypothetical protein, partial [Stenotrophomonas maltophilia]|uniref:hypothetical protein n=1 Tax=Stenotrophomonas maltophilia TaxID=40324 RepID=UPI00195550DF
SLFFSREKKSNQKKRAAIREPALRAGALCSSVNQGTAPNSLRSNSGASSPLIPLRCSARYKADPTAASARMTALGRAKPCLAAFAFAFAFAFALPCPPPSTRAGHGLGFTATAHTGSLLYPEDAVLHSQPHPTKNPAEAGFFA